MSSNPEGIGDLSDYRQALISASQQSQQAYDRHLLSLSGGGLAISFVFLDKVIGHLTPIKPGLLLLSWFSWGFCILCVLASFFFSERACRIAISQVDKGSIYDRPVGGFSDKATLVFNVVAGLAFCVGVFQLSMFVHANLTRKP